MDRLSVTTIANPDGTFTTRWQWRQNDTKQPSRGGTANVSLAPRWNEDRDILAELAAIHHILCVEQVHGQNRLGTSLEVEVTFGAIRKALLKGAIKTTDKGDTDKHRVALFAKFLATKFFEAKISVIRPDKWRDDESKSTANFMVSVDRVPGVTVESSVGPVVISRHALNRVVGRHIAKDIAPDEDDLLKVPDEKWSRAWRFLEKVLPAATKVDIPLKERARIIKEYGRGVSALLHRDSQCVFILQQEKYGLEMVTMLKDSEYCRITPKLPTQVGQRLEHRMRT